MPTMQNAVLTRRRIAGVALLISAVVFLAASAPSIGAQQPPAPHWFWGTDLSSYTDAEIKVFDQNGSEVDPNGGNCQGDQHGRVDPQGTWSVCIHPDDARQISLRLVTADVSRETDLLDVRRGGFGHLGRPGDASISISDFRHAITETLTVRIIARRAPDGRVEFGMRPPVGDDIFPRARYFPATGPDHNRWLRSSEIDFGDGIVGRIIARRAPDGRVEFGFRVAGYDDLFPPARYFPATGPDHNRWLRSSEIEIGRPQ